LSNKPIAIALRSSLYRPNEIRDLAKIADDSGVEALFFPDISGGVDAMNLCSFASGATNGIKLASGVIRPLEYSARDLIRGVAAVQFVSNNRFILGVGTGHPGPKPRETIENMVRMLEEVRSTFKKNNATMPETYFATLRYGIAKQVLNAADGLILNFCSPSYCSKLIGRLRSDASVEKKRIACYIKIFYSKEDASARRLLVDEFVNYDRIPSYHKMFDVDGVARDIESAKANIESIAAGEEIPESLLRISLANPSPSALLSLIQKFQQAGINLPVVYPYFGLNEDGAFKREIVSSIAKL
jgi:hypothetical protein